VIILELAGHGFGRSNSSTNGRGIGVRDGIEMVEDHGSGLLVELSRVEILEVVDVRQAKDVLSEIENEFRVSEMIS